MNKIVYLKNIIEELQKGRQNLIPCNAEEIEKLHGSLAHNLPKAYLEFLQIMGKNAGNFMKGSSCFIHEIPYLREWAEELLEENQFPEKLPKDTFVFWMHQGYQFAFFNLYESDNPSIYYYSEIQSQLMFEKKYKTFTNFLEVELEVFNTTSI